MNNNMLFIFIFLITFQILAQERVVRIIDGDTFELLSGEKVRLIGIDAPEMKEKYGVESKNYLTSLIWNKDVILKNDSITKEKDMYGRLLRYTFIDSEDINNKMIRDGFAKVYAKYSFTKRNEYKKSEQLAKKEKLGLWEKANVDNEENNATKYYFICAGILILLVFLFYFLKK